MTSLSGIAKLASGLDVLQLLGPNWWLRWLLPYRLVRDASGRVLADRSRITDLGQQPHLFIVLSRMHVTRQATG